MMRTASQAMHPGLLARAYRSVRRILKRPMLWLNAWRYKETEEEVAHLVMLRESAIKREQWLRQKQVRLAEKRNQIAGW
jgi:hypothetical protein